MPRGPLCTDGQAAGELPFCMVVRGSKWKLWILHSENGDGLWYSLLQKTMPLTSKLAFLDACINTGSLPCNLKPLWLESNGNYYTTWQPPGRTHKVEDHSSWALSLWSCHLASLWFVRNPTIHLKKALNVRKQRGIVTKIVSHITSINLDVLLCTFNLEPFTCIFSINKQYLL